RNSGSWTVNGLVFDVSRVDATPQEGTAEIWVFQNNSGAWQHPIHVHMDEFQILTVNGLPPLPQDVARKDMVRLAFNEEVRVFAHFRDWLGRYPIHCHNTVHEDHAMMGRFDVVP